MKQRFPKSLTGVRVTLGGEQTRVCLLTIHNLTYIRLVCMKKRVFITTAALLIWLFNYLVCFCCIDCPNGHPDTNLICGIAIGEHKDLAQDNCASKFPSGCHCACGLQIFTLSNNQISLVGVEPTSSISLMSTACPGQSYLISIFHPPKA